MTPLHVTIAVIAILLSYFLLQNYYYKFDYACTTTFNATYTHIIVGAGSSGCVLAARLSENQSNRVLLVEAGGHFNFFAKVPLLAPLLQRSNYDWQYETEPQLFSSRGFFERKQYMPRGKGLGGTGQMNFMVHGCLEENAEWSCFESFGLEEFEQPFLSFYRNEYTNKKDKYETRKKIKSSKLSEVLMRAVVELNSSGVFYRPSISTIHEGERWSTFVSHLVPAISRHNLHIMCNTEVTKLIFNNQIATAIKVVNNNSKETIIFSEIEIILAAGSINTPKLLFLSGIGHISELQKLNIPIVANLQGVGLNLYDHINFPLYASIEAPISVTIQKLLSVTEVVNYLLHKTGLWSETPVQGSAYLPPDINLLLFGLGSTDESQLRAIANYMPETFRSSFPLHHNISREGFVFLTTCLKPKSRGFLKLKDTNPFSDPIINPLYLQKASDIKCMKKGIKLITKITSTKPFEEIGTRLYYPNFPNCPQFRKTESNEQYLECVIRTAAITTYHPGGTCKMGKRDDDFAVVDHNFRVRGVSRLRVVDASVLPEPISGFPNSLIVLLAEYAAYLINTQ